MHSIDVLICDLLKSKSSDREIGILRRNSDLNSVFFCFFNNKKNEWHKETLFNAHTEIR